MNVNPVAQRGAVSPAVEQFLEAAVQRGQVDRLLVLEALAQGHLAVYQLGNALQCLERWLDRFNAIGARSVPVTPALSSARSH